MGCVVFFGLAVTWIVGVAAALFSAYYQLLARPHFLPRSFGARHVSPLARFRSRNYAPAAQALVSRMRLSLGAFLMALAVGFALTKLDLYPGAGSC